MNKLRRNITNRRFTVEGMRYDFCQANCDDYCFMVSCSCGYIEYQPSENLFNDAHDRADQSGYKPNFDSVQ